MSLNDFDNLRPAYINAAEKLRENVGQWQAYESVGNCVVLAGPGSGKTKTLTIKMARMMYEDVRPPHGIACITYSNECARELTRRLDQLGIVEGANVFIGTVHSFCLQHVVRPYAKLAQVSIPDPLRIADEKTWYDIFGRAVVKAGIDEKPSYLKTTFDRYRRTHLDRQDVTWYGDSHDMPILVEHFESMLHGTGFLDFDDIVLIGLDLIKRHDWIQSALRARFPILVIDEYQDLGIPLHQIVLTLSQQGIRVLAVGDPDQSIYRFTGAEPRLLRELSGRTGFAAISLKKNYRCGRKIVAGSLIALAQNREYVAAQLHEGSINFWECPNGIKQQAEVICTEIVPQVLKASKDRKLGDVAVLYLDKYDASVLISAAKAAKLKYICGDKGSSYIRSPLTRWLEDCAAWCSGGWEKGSPRLSALTQFWLRMHIASVGSQVQAKLRREFVSFLWKYRNANTMTNAWLNDLIFLGLREAIRQDPARTDEAESLESLVTAASDPDKIADFTLQDFGSLRGSPTRLNLITLHSSKGLEFDVVIMIGLEQGRIPDWRAAGEDFEEERRKFYVGITRAAREVHLVYSGWYVTSRGYRFNKGRSMFVDELEHNLS